MLHQQMLMALSSLVEAYAERGDDHKAHLYATRQLALEPYREEAHRQLMRLFARRGLYAEALAQYQTCRRLLRAELGVEPDSTTLALYAQIRAGALPKRTTQPQGAADDTLAAPHARAEALPSGWNEVPETARIYGRQAELAHLEEWIVQERCRMGIPMMSKRSSSALMVGSS